jgi:fructose-bisphosphate aldolase class I
MTELTRHLDVLPAGQMVMLKLTIPDTPDRYRSLTTRATFLCVVALSGGYSRDEACQRLTGNHGMIASFSRALTEGLHHRMSDAAFDAAISLSIGEIYRASTVKH